MLLKARANELDPDMIEVYDPEKKNLWFVVHKDLFFYLQDDEELEEEALEEALEEGYELNFTIEAWLPDADH